MWTIDKYVDWLELWEEEVCLDTSIDLLEETEDKTDGQKESIKLMRAFLDHNSSETGIFFEIQKDDCELLASGCMIIVWGAEYNHSECNPEGNYMRYEFLVDDEFNVIKATYEQG